MFKRYLPPSHRHDEAPSLEKKPTGHFVQEDEPSFENVPAGQGEQEEDSFFEEYVPAEHLMQVVFPSKE